MSKQEAKMTRSPSKAEIMPTVAVWWAIPLRQVLFCSQYCRILDVPTANICLDSAASGFTSRSVTC